MYKKIFFKTSFKTEDWLVPSMVASNVITLVILKLCSFGFQSNNSRGSHKPTSNSRIQPSQGSEMALSLKFNFVLICEYQASYESTVLFWFWQIWCEKTLERMGNGKYICTLGYGVKIKRKRLGSRVKRSNVFRARQTTLGDLGSCFCEVV